MKKKVISRLLAGFVIFSQICFAQSPLPQQMPPYYINNLSVSSTNGIQLYQSENIISTGNVNEPVNISGTAKVDYKASKEVELKPGFTASDFTGDGEFHAYIEPLPFEVAWFEPTDNVGTVPKYEKLELGIGLPQDLQDKINNFLADNCTNQANCINPFNDEEISVEILLTPPSGNSNTRYGFYMKDYEILSGGILPGFLDGWNELSTDYPWRIRLALDELGHWAYTVKIYLDENHVQIPGEFSGNFQCVASDNKGFLEVGQTGNYLRYNGSHESFYIIGENMESNWLNPIIANNQYPTWVDQLADNGGNYFEVFLGPHSFSFEREVLNNYANNYSWPYYDWSPNHIWGAPPPDYHITPGQMLNRQMNAWELDRLVHLAKEYNVKVQFGQAGGYQPLPEDIYGNDNGEWMNFDWKHNCYNTNSLNPDANNGEITDVFVQKDFITSAMARKYHKKYWRYISSRWGYSTTVSAYEIQVETDGVFGLGLGNQAENDIQLFNWANDIFNYLKNELHDPHLVTLSTRGGYEPDHSLDNFFGDFINQSIYTVYKNDHINISNTVNDFKENYNRPYLIGEIGEHDISSQSRNYFHNNLWGVCCQNKVD